MAWFVLMAFVFGLDWGRERVGLGEDNEGAPAKARSRAEGESQEEVVVGGKERVWLCVAPCSQAGRIIQFPVTITPRGNKRLPFPPHRPVELCLLFGGNYTMVSMCWKNMCDRCAANSRFRAHR